MSNGGVSWGQVVNAIESHVGPVQHQVNQLTSHVGTLSAAVRELEAEVAGIGNAIQGMTATLAHKLDGVSHGQHQLLEAQRSTHAMTLEQFVSANTQLNGLHQTSANGFSAVTGGLDHVSSDVKLVDGSVRQMTIAMAQMEVIRIMNDAKGPIDRLKGFAEEIDERFGKAVENVYMVRSQYDHLLATSMTEYDRKLHVIGDHIFAIYEQDFRPQVELPLTSPPRAFVALPMDVDERRLEARADVLEANLLESSQSMLDPLLETQRSLEHVMASKYATDLASAMGDVSVAMDLRFYDEDAQTPLDVVVGARVEKAPPTGAEGTSTYFRLVDRSLGVRETLARGGERIARQCQLRPVTTDERAALLEALGKLADDGALDRELLEGYADYLTEFGLDVANHEGGAR
jgi:outer membrane murein-binding lipoprotein Lpp